jgi:ribonuclease HI
LLECPDISLQVCSALNLASLFPTDREPLMHSCEEVLAKCYSARPDLLDQPLLDPDLTLFMDGSSFIWEGIRWAGVAVVSLTETLWAEHLPPSTSAQLAELTALTKALQLSEGKNANIYPDSKCAFLVLHAHAVLRKEWGLLTAEGSPIRYSKETLNLLKAALLPQQIAAIHCPGHKGQRIRLLRETKELIWQQRRPLRDLMFKPLSCGNDPSFLWTPRILTCWTFTGLRKRLLLRSERMVHSSWGQILSPTE